jgi:hypothetical protein
MGSTILRIEELGQRHSAVMWTGRYLKFNEYLSGQRGLLYSAPAVDLSSAGVRPVWRLATTA